MAERYTVDQDIREAQAMVDGLERYLKGDQLYGTVGGGGIFSGGNMPSLTVGALLMRLRRLDALRDKLSEQQRQQLALITDKHNAVRKEWRYHYEQKLTWEANSRLDAMRTFFEECSDPKLCARIYLPEVLRRTIVEECLIVLQDLNVELDDALKLKIKGTDSRLRRFVKPASFVWAAELQSAYDEKRFWWMYSRPPEI